MNWNMPYGTMGISAASAVDHVSPLSDIVVTTPPSPRGASSPMTVAVREMTAIERARLFVEGRQMDLLKSLDIPQRTSVASSFFDCCASDSVYSTLSTWMYQYWLFAFKTAKHWGRGPQNWTASILGFDDYCQRTTVLISLPHTPAASIGTPTSQPTPRRDEMIDLAPTGAEKMPPSLCRWSIHCQVINYERLPSPPHSPTEGLNPNDEESWPRWPSSATLREYPEKLNDSLESNDFSNVKLDDLPIAVDHIARAARRSPNELLKEAIGFSIMGRNLELMFELLEDDLGNRTDVTGLYPLHLAVAYLDGSKTCCSILDGLEELDPQSLRKLYVNDLGHTILDQLMITILKAHTSCLPSVVDVAFKKEKRFEGEEVDICGRWDADSDCVRTLMANGNSRIPFEWKHVFCHTSVQTICHCIGTLFGPYWSPNINAPSGLFVRRCLQCGLKLQLLPLHTSVLVGLQLSYSGCKGETLFGILACLLCLLSNGANPLLKANISIQALLGSEELEDCNHEEIDPVELAEKVPTTLKLEWSKELSIGWEVVCNALRRSQAEWKARSSKRRTTSNEMDAMSPDEEAGHEPHLPAECPDNQYHQNFFGKDKALTSLWAAIQTELLTYRRLEKGGEWMSQNFNMHTLNEGLISRGEVDIELVQKEMMKPFCDCGQFPDAVPACPILEDAASYYFSNLDDWNRTTFIGSPAWRLREW